MATPRKKPLPYGQGTISLRKDGKWMGRLEAGTNPNGTRRRVTVYGADEAEVARKLEKKRAQIAREGVSIATRSATVKAWATKWLTIREKTQRPNAYAADRTAVTNWIIPVLGTSRLESLTPADVRKLKQAQLDAGNKSTSALRTHRTLIKLLKDAALEGYDVPRRIFLVEAPSAGASDREGLEVDDAIAMLAEAAALPHGSMWATALLQGMRPGECLGLTWPAVDFGRGLITVEWQLQTLRYLDRNNKALGFRVPDDYEAIHLEGNHHLVRPKSKKGFRVIPMVPWIREALLAWKEIAPASPHDLVWPALDGGPSVKAGADDEWDGLQGAAALRRWNELEAAGEKPAGLGHPSGRYYVPHEARHTTATLLLEAGVDHHVITAILGHSSIVTSRGYQHVRTQLASKALEQIAAQLQLGPKSLES
jgi:integrase